MEKWQNSLRFGENENVKIVRMKLGREALSIFNILLFRLSNTSTDFTSDRKKYLLWLKVKPYNIKHASSICSPAEP